MRAGEVKIISVTPVSRGLVRPLLFVVAATALVVVGAHRLSIIHQHQTVLAFALVGPFVVVALTRAGRWRSHKVHVTNRRVIQEGGVLRHHSTSIEIRDVVATRVDQRVAERLSRRGLVVLETVAGPFVLATVRHPAALCRVIDAERVDESSDPVPLDTVFSFEEPEPFNFEGRPRRRDARRRHEWDG